MHAFSLLYALVAASAVLAHPMHHTPERRELRIVNRSAGSVRVARATTSLDVLSEGNKAFRDESAATDPGLIKKLADEGQAPPFIFLGCSDSRVNEGTIFKSKPGTFFSQRNIANQYARTDLNTEAVLSYGVSVLGAEHVIVMGHYGCGGVAAAIASAPSAQVDAGSGSVQAWIEPIREMFASSTRSEIVELRNKLAGQTNIPEPEISEPGFRALVEENVKAGVKRISTDSMLVNHYALLGQSTNSTSTDATITRRAEAGPPKDVFVHGFVYDIETGVVHNLGVSTGPPGKAIPPIPFEAVKKAAEGVTASPSQSSSAPSTTSTSTTPAATSSSSSAAVESPSASASPTTTQPLEIAATVY